jgi:hypothetical protein
VRCEWIVHDDYVSWCPLPPAQVRYKDPWDGDARNPWVTVPAKKFKETDVANHRVPAKFKSATSHRYLRHAPPEPGSLERSMGHPIDVTDVRLDQWSTGSNIVTRVVLPPEEQAIVDRHRDAPQSKSSTGPYPASKPSSGDKGDKDDNSSNDKQSQPAKKETPTKFKEKAKETPEKKDGGKSKGK